MLARFAKGMVLAVLALTLAAGPTWAAAIYDTSALGELIGSRTEGAGITAGGNYATDNLTLRIDWSITDLGGGNWHYRYVWSGYRAPDISHVILDLSDDCVPSNPGCVTNAVFASTTGNKEFNTFGPGPSNPGFPAAASINGVKFDDVIGGAPFTLDFDSNRPPVYGDFYIKGGATSFAYNSGLPDHSSINLQDFIARPNHESIPYPATLVLLGSGLLGLGIAACRGRRAR